MVNTQTLTPDEVYDIIYMAHMDACMNYEQPLSQEEANDYLSQYPEVQDADGKKVTFQATYVPVECEQLAFNEIIQREEILAYFQNGMVTDEDFLRMWKVYKG